MQDINPNSSLLGGWLAADVWTGIWGRGGLGKKEVKKHKKEIGFRVFLVDLTTVE